MRINEDVLISGPGGEHYQDVVHIGPYSLKVSVFRPAAVAARAEVEVWTDLSGWQTVWEDAQPDKGTIGNVVDRLLDRAEDVLQISGS